MLATRRHGFSTVEVLVATALIGILVAGALGIFMSWRTSSSASDRRSRIEEYGHRALTELSDAVRAAGYVGCARVPNIVDSALATSDDPRWDFTGGAIRGYDGVSDSQSRQIDPTLTPGATSHSDVLLVQRPRERSRSSYLKAAMLSTRDSLRVDTTADMSMRPGSVALVASCEARAYFVATAVTNDTIEHVRQDHSAGPANVSDDLNHQFDVGAEVLSLDVVVYYVGSDPEARSPALMRRLGSSPPETVVTGVEEMQLEYGIDEDRDNTVDEYKPASEISQWTDVLSVSLVLKLRAGQDEATGKRVPPEEFRGVVALRNVQRPG